MAGNFKADPDNVGWFFGWAVLKDSPWNLSSFHDNEADARTAASTLDGYEVRYGSKKEGTDDFVGS